MRPVHASGDRQPTPEFTAELGCGYSFRMAKAKTNNKGTGKALASPPTGKQSYRACYERFAPGARGSVAVNGSRPEVMVPPAS